jgi:hypothetical protein
MRPVDNFRADTFAIGLSRHQVSVYRTTNVGLSRHLGSVYHATRIAES